MPADPEADPAANVLGALALVVTDLTGRAVTEACGLSMSGAAALSALREFLDKPTLDDLRRVLGLTPSGAVRLVDRLAADGLVRRGPGTDKRSRSVVLTARGRRSAERIAAARADVLRGVLAQLSPAERPLVSTALESLTAAVVTVKEGGAWTCRLCDLRACQRAEGRCPAYNAAVRRFTP